jgi:hypothetical protein
MPAHFRVVAVVPPVNAGKVTGGGTVALRIIHTPNAMGYFALLRRLVLNWLNIKVVSLPT